MKCTQCGISIPEMPEDSAPEELLCNGCYEKSEAAQGTSTHSIYARKRGTKSKFRPVDLNTGKIVRNLFYATMVPEARVHQILAELSEGEPGQYYEFQARPI